MPSYVEILQDVQFPPFESTAPEALSEVAALFQDDTYPHRKREMVELVFLQLVAEERRAPAPARRAELAEMALRVVERVADELGGGNFYLHKATTSTLRARARDAVIVRDFNGSNILELARKHDLTEMRVRQILAAARQAAGLKVPGARATSKVGGAGGAPIEQGRAAGGQPGPSSPLPTTNHPWRR